MNDPQLLTIICPVSMKNTLVDALMDYQNISGFTMTKVSGYSRKHSDFNTKEQVAGYRWFYRLEVVLNSEQTKPLLRYLCQFKGGYSLRYWLLPLTDTGVIDSDSNCLSMEQDLSQSENHQMAKDTD